MSSATQQQPRLSLPLVLETGLRIADEEGLEALTMRRLAAELDVTTMATYTYVRTKEELVDAIAALVLADLPFDDRPGDTWERRLEHVVHALYTALREHPAVAQIVPSRRRPIPALDGFRETLLTILDDAGFEPEISVQAVSALTSYAAGFAATAQARSEARPDDEAARLRGLPRESFPRLSSSADLYARHISEDAFLVGLRSFIAGLDAERS